MNSLTGNQLTAITTTVFALHMLGWGGVYVYAAQDHPALVGLATLAYVFGLRHAFDPDHIAAIDTTTRRLMADGRRPLTVGLWFALGHSTIVLVMTAAIAFFTHATTAALPRLHEIGQIIGATISGVFLYAIGLLNLVIVIDLFRVLRQTREGTIDGPTMEARLRTGGSFSRWSRGLFGLIQRPWQMYLVGALFGLGFDTATEIGLLTTVALAASQPIPIAAVLCLPIVFAAGMSMMDAADGILMCRAYGWAVANPRHRIVHNVVMTGVSVIVAFVIGTIQLVSH